ncbi:hypothetical protein DL89DRAFT_308092 [Linderina pennispora]|uniref:Uncharacterized protein n=1 Tax=Linderina pennispora TaxID=61395 RepID=A0A1Y1WHD9_9FUNG|nr:uncharacterized protein DL89DRAFT_308092 [Linderina pennispora]ORX72646.1 hypothetical protein DL89DRAFT_308092 [Linderina pennispora]
MSKVPEWLKDTNNTIILQLYEQGIKDCAGSSPVIQTNWNSAGLGTARFNIDGSRFTWQWRKSHRDGAAPPASSIISYVQYLVSYEKSIGQYHNGGYLTSSVVKVDV